MKAAKHSIDICQTDINLEPLAAKDFAVAVAVAVLVVDQVALPFLLKFDCLKQLLFQARAHGTGLKESGRLDPDASNEFYGADSATGASSSASGLKPFGNSMRPSSASC